MIKVNICQCCLMALANGDESGCRDFWNHRDGEGKDHPAGLMGKLEGYWVAPGDGEAFFSTSECDGCGDRLHGDRFECVIVEELKR